MQREIFFVFFCQLLKKNIFLSVPSVYKRNRFEANIYFNTVGEKLIKKWPHTHKIDSIVVPWPVINLQYVWNVKRQGGMSSSKILCLEKRGEQLGPGTPSVSVYSLSWPKDSCFQAVIRQPWGSVKTLFSFHLNCCIHPANWNPATGSQALSLKCCQVIVTRECGIMVVSDAWLSLLIVMPLFQSHHRCEFFPLSFTNISFCPLLFLSLFLRDTRSNWVLSFG